VTRDVRVTGILIVAAVAIGVLRTFEKYVFRPIMGRGFRLRGE